MKSCCDALAAVNNNVIGDYIPLLADKSFPLSRGEGHKTELLNQGAYIFFIFIPFKKLLSQKMIVIQIY